MEHYFTSFHRFNDDFFFICWESIVWAPLHWWAVHSPREAAYMKNPPCRANEQLWAITLEREVTMMALYAHNWPKSQL